MKLQQFSKIKLFLLLHLVLLLLVTIFVRYFKLISFKFLSYFILCNYSFEFISKNLGTSFSDWSVFLSNFQSKKSICLFLKICSILNLKMQNIFLSNFLFYLLVVIHINTPLTDVHFFIQCTQDLNLRKQSEAIFVKFHQSINQNYHLLIEIY